MSAPISEVSGQVTPPAPVSPETPLIVPHVAAVGEVWEQRWLWIFMALGLAARCIRYLLNFPLWEDECFLCINYIERSYADLLQPLAYDQVAPPLFLWVELTLVKLLGFTEWSLRLFPFMCSVASLFLFRRLAGHLVRGTPLVLAVAIFATAYPGIRYGAEAKQYGSDQLAAMILLVLTVEWWRRPEQLRWLWALAGVVPVLVGLSYPAVFVAGGVSVFVALTLWARGQWRGLLALATYNVLLVGGFGVLLLTARNQSAASGDVMTHSWRHQFPPLAAPLRIPAWFVEESCGGFLAYPVGGDKWGSALTFVACLIGLAALVRRRCWLLLALMLTPLGLHLIAAAMRRYPYGGHVRFSQHLAPLICLTLSVGITALLGLVRARQRPALAYIVCLSVFLLLGAGSIARDIRRPCKTLSDQRARAFAQWFWLNAEFQGEAVCLTSDLHLQICPSAFKELSWTAMYLCNQRIYSPRHAAGRPPCLDKVSSDHPLRCLYYRDPRYPHDQAALDRWLADMQTRYQLSGKETYPFVRYTHTEGSLKHVDHVEIFRFVPRDVARNGPLVPKSWQARQDG